MGPVTLRKLVVYLTIVTVVTTVTVGGVGVFRLRASLTSEGVRGCPGLGAAVTQVRRKWDSTTSFEPRAPVRVHNGRRDST